MTELPRIASFQVADPSGAHNVAYADWGDGSNEARGDLLPRSDPQRARFRRSTRRLASDGFRVICPDVAGRGRSDWLKEPEQYGYAQYIADMTAR